MFIDSFIGLPSIIIAIGNFSSNCLLYINIVYQAGWIKLVGFAKKNTEGYLISTQNEC